MSADLPVGQAKHARTSSPIACLPPDVLLRIFMLNRDMHLDTEADYGSSNAWIRVTHTCSAWRKLCLGTETLSFFVQELPL